MIGSYRLIPRILSKNVRRLFFHSPESGITPLKSTTTKTKKLDHVSLCVGNARVLRITDPNFSNKDVVHCAFRVGVGSEDDPDTCRGLAHLLEHVVVKHVWSEHRETLNLKMDAETEEFETIYSFIVDKSDYRTAIETFSKYLFSTTHLTTYPNNEAFTKLELECFDNEFHEKRGGVSSLKLVEILRLKGINLAKFGAGNRTTLSETYSDLMIEFEKLRELYRQRPLKLCVYSAHKLNINNIFKSLNCERFLFNQTQTKAKSTEWEDASDFSKHLFVVQSDDDVLQLQLLYPLSEKLNINEQNTFDFIIKMIKCEIDGYLAHYLLKKKLGTKCDALLIRRTFLITVHLTEKGLEEAHNVSWAVRNYLKFLHTEWTNFEKLKYRENEVHLNMAKIDKESNYATHVATHWDGENNAFDENNEFDKRSFCKPLPLSEEQTLISKHILDNTNVIHIIAERRPQRVHRVLRKHHPKLFKMGSAVETEPIFNTKFHLYETDLFTLNLAQVTDFTVTDLSQFSRTKAESHHAVSSVFRTERTDVLFQKLCVTYLELQSAHIRAICEQLFPGHNEFKMEPDGVTYNVAGVDTSLFESHLEMLDLFAHMNDEDFDRCKKRLMRNLSEEMTDSVQLADSLMRTALYNLHNEANSIPTPMQYNLLLEMNRSHYVKYFEKIHSCQFEPPIKDFSDNVIPFKKQFCIQSINQNEMLTVTQLFCETDTAADDVNLESLCRKMSRILAEENDNLGLYIPQCSIKTLDGRTGILINIKSVEAKDNQKSDKIRNLCKDIVTKRLPNKLKNAEQKKLLEYLANRRILIQVIGHENSSITENTFENRFRHWYRDHKAIFKKLSDVGQ